MSGRDEELSRLLRKALELQAEADDLRQQADGYEHGCDPRSFDRYDTAADDREREAGARLRKLIELAREDEADDEADV